MTRPCDESKAMPQSKAMQCIVSAHKHWHQQQHDDSDTPHSPSHGGKHWDIYSLPARHTAQTQTQCSGCCSELQILSLSAPGSSTGSQRRSINVSVSQVCSSTRASRHQAQHLHCLSQIQVVGIHGLGVSNSRDIAGKLYGAHLLTVTQAPVGTRGLGQSRATGTQSRASNSEGLCVRVRIMPQ